MRVTIAVVLLAASTGVASAQAIRGKVVEAGSATPIPEAQLTLLDAAGETQGSVIADSTGAFELTVPGPGTYTLRATHIGYATTEARDIEARSGELLDVEVRMGVRAIPIEPLRVTARSRYNEGRIGEYYRRRDWGEKTGIGRFVTREEIENRHASRVTDLLRTVPGISVVPMRSTGRQAVAVRRGGSGCVPDIYIDGMQINRNIDAYLDEYISPESVEGIEIYRGAGEAPAEYYDTRGCGVILVWSRPAPRNGKPLTWRRVAVGGGILLMMLILSR